MKRFLKRATGRILQAFRFPGMIKPFEYDDLITGFHIKVRTSKGYTVLSLDGREFFFDRWNGFFDGTGYAMCSKEPEALKLWKATESKINTIRALPQSTTRAEMKEYLKGETAAVHESVYRSWEILEQVKMLCKAGVGSAFIRWLIEEMEHTPGEASHSKGSAPAPVSASD